MRLIRSAIMWYLATSTSICNASSRRAATASRVAVEPKLDIARYHMFGPSINLMNFSAVTIFLARVVVDFILDWCSCHSGGVLWNERARRRKPQNVSGQSSVALSHRRKLSYAHCCTNPRKRVLSLRTRSLFRFHIGVRLGRKLQWENFVCFLQCSMISDCPPGHASEVSKERFLEENDFSCSWPLSQQVRTTVSTKRPDIDAWDCMHGLQPLAFRTRWSSNLPHHSRFLPSSAFPVFSPPFSPAVRWSATNGTLRPGALAACCKSSLGAQLAQLRSCRHTHVHPATRAVA